MLLHILVMAYYRHKYLHLLFVFIILLLASTTHIHFPLYDDILESLEETFRHKFQG